MAWCLVGYKPLLKAVPWLLSSGGYILPVFCYISVYDAITGQMVKELKGHRACVRDVHWHPYEQKIISTSVSDFKQIKFYCVILIGKYNFNTIGMFEVLIVEWFIRDCTDHLERLL